MASDPPKDLGHARRGFLWLTGAKLHFMLMGWAIYFVLPNVFLDQVAFGELLVVIGLVSILNNVMVASAMQTVSRFTAELPHARNRVLRTGLGLFFLVGAVITVGLIVGAPWIARAEADAGLTPLYRAAAPIAMAYAVYAVCIGRLNGSQRFGPQAAFDAAYATLRVGFMIGGAALLVSATGALAGYSAAAVLICALALIAVGRRALHVEANGPPLLRTLVVFAAPLALIHLTLNVLIRTDLLMVKAMAGRVLSSGALAADAASRTTAHYGTAQIFSLLPYQALIALTMVVFPLVAEAKSGHHSERLRTTISGALRFALIFGAGLTAVLAAQPAGIIDVVYPAPYRAGGVALRGLAFGVIGLSLITLSASILNAAGYLRRTLGLTLTTWIAQLVAVTVTLRRAASAEDVLGQTAWASAAVLLVGGVAAVLLLRITFGRILGWPTPVRVLIATAGATLGGSALPSHSTGATLIACVATLTLYLLILALTGELGRKDLKTILKLRR